jgi:hypothetical protein
MSQITRKLVWLALFTFSPVLAQQQLGSENSAMERYGATLGENRNLHNLTDKLPDGSKGYALVVSKSGSSAAQTVVAGNTEPNPSDSLNASDFHLRARICGSAAIIVGKEVGSKSVITANKAFIYTKHEVQVTRVIRNQTGITVGQLISIVQPGGSITDGGEKFTVLFPQLTPAVVGQKYLYILIHLQDAPADLFVPSPSRKDDNIQISSGRIILGKGGHDSFVTGESVQDASDHIKNLLTKVPCSAK